MTLKDVASTPRARRGPLTRASYNASLFIVLNVRANAYHGGSSLFGGVRTKLASELSLEEYSSVPNSEVSSFLQFL